MTVDTHSSVGCENEEAKLQNWLKRLHYVVMWSNTIYEVFFWCTKFDPKEVINNIFVDVCGGKISVGGREVWQLCI